MMLLCMSFWLEMLEEQVRISFLSTVAYSMYAVVGITGDIDKED